MSGQAGRYQRSLSGMVGALLVTLLAIGAYVGFRALNRDELDVRPEPIALRDAVLAGQDAGVHPVYPDPLPAGWTATSFDVGSPDEPAWGLGLHTDEGRYVGLRREEASLDDLLETYVDENAREGDPVTIAGAVAREWRTWSDERGDTAYVAETGRGWLLVYGSAPPSQLRAVAESLTEEPVSPPPTSG